MARRILYLGRESGTCLHRAKALRRLGHAVEIIDPYGFLPENKWVNMWIWKTGALFLGGHVENRILAMTAGKSFDLVWVDCGELLGPGIIRKLRERFACPAVNLNLDDPFGRRDGAKWRLYLKAVPEYDLLVVVRDRNVAEAQARGARNVLRLTQSADEVAHAPRHLSAEERRKWASEVLFIGTWMPERGPFFARLIELGVPLAIYGDRWQRAAEWPVLRNHWRGPGLYRDEDYASAILSAKVCLGLLSKGNQDLVTSRTFEIPSLGRALCAERTSEHLALYREGEEAEFWSTPEECARKCELLLANAEWREALAANGRRRLLRNGGVNQAVLTAVLNRLFQETMEDRPVAVNAINTPV